MSAAELRQAAETLRERARAATVGPWEAYRRHDERVGSPDWFGVCAESAGDLDGDIFEDSLTKAADATFIATIHPGVGLALADWLDATVVLFGEPGHRDWHAPEKSALAVARLINGGQS